MLSILIPTYNYNIVSLVESIKKQLEKHQVIYEILVLDDGSTNQESIKNNKVIDKFPYCSFTLLSNNVGRSKIRNLLAQKAQYKSLLFLDADVIPLNDNFMENYIALLPLKLDIVYGGIVYQKTKPAKNQVLRWKYGKKKEALPIKERKKNPYISFLTLNFLIRKSVFETISFNEEIPNLRCEDTLFAIESKKHQLNIDHIENPVIHLGLETSEIFLKKSLESIDVRKSFVKNKILLPEDTKITRLAKNLERLRLGPLIVLFYKLTRKILKKNIISEHPLLVMFDLYRLGYYFNGKIN